MSPNKPGGPRSVALIGPYSSGKTSLLESLLFVTGTIKRKGTARERNMTGDSAAEAKARQMGVEVNAASYTYLDDPFTVLDCPGSIEFLQETLNVLVGVDAAVIVCEPDVAKVQALAPLFKRIEDAKLPVMVFVNKIDKATGPVQAVADALQSVSARPLVLRHLPIEEGERIAGYVDLASERAYHYAPNAASTMITTRDDALWHDARAAMLEKLADFDDHLMEELLEDIKPERDEVYQNLTRDFQEALIVPVLLGAAETDQGVRRLLKALRHEVPAADRAAARAGIPLSGGEPLAQALKTLHTAHGGKLTIARVWRGAVKDGMTLSGERVAGLHRMLGAHTDKLAEAKPGDVVALGRLEKAKTGDVLSGGKDIPELPKAETLTPVFALAITAANRNDEVKLSGAMAKLHEEDPSVVFEQEREVHELLLKGQGDMHLRVAVDRLKSKYALAVESRRPSVAYKEAIRRSVSQHGRHKRQTGGHGQFGDVHIDIAPLPRGTGFVFVDKVVGGSVPRNFIPAVEDGARDYMSKGPLGFPVVDVSVTLTDGSYHAVDSSEMAFKTAARIAMTEGMAKCDPVLLEPIYKVQISVPNDATSRVNALVNGRRGHILSFDSRPGWAGWDTIACDMPQSELHDLIVELRSLTQGVGSYTASFDRLQELTGRLADQVLAAHTKAAQ
jgi:elongation factor G